MNKSDSEKMLSLIENEGYTETDEPSDADLIIVNTCSVRKNAVDRLDANISNYKKLKKHKKSLIIAIGGCVAQHEKDKLQERFPFIDIVFGTHNFHLLPQLIKERQASNEPVVAICDEPTDYDDVIISKRTSDFHGWITIITGCSNFCSYCIVPYVRGEEKSRPVGKIIQEAQEYVKDGVITVTLLGQNVDSYGKDMDPQTNLSQLLIKLHDIKELECIRFLTSHPKDISEELIDTVASLPKVGKFFHFPLQAGDDEILRLMNRKYTVEKYAAIIDKIRAQMPFACITSDLIVGFPSETEEQFLNTVEAVKRFSFDSVNTAAYSPRPLTHAAKMKDQLPMAEKQRRLIYLNQVVNETALKQNEKLVGHSVKTIVEQYNDKKKTFGSRTFANKIVHFNGTGEENLLAKVVTLKITRAGSHSLSGELIPD